MTRYLIAATVALLLVAAAGYGIYVKWMSQPAIAKTAPQAPPRPAEPAPAPPAVTAPPPVRIARVQRVEGTVERRAGSSWVEVHAGDQLTAQDAIRTGAKSRAEIDIGASVVVEPATAITVGEISTHVSKVVLSAGHVSANARSGTTIRISTPDARTFAESAAGAFDVLSSGTGQVTVATRRGSARVTSRGGSVAVGEGTQTIVIDDDAPTEPTAIPSSLFLKISAAGTDREVSAIRGETTPGAVVTINGERAAPGDDGKFARKVAFPKDTNVIVIMVEDAMGRHETKVVRRTAQPVYDAPKLETSVDWQ